MNMLDEMHEEFVRDIDNLTWWQALMIAACVIALFGLVMSGCASRQSKVKELIYDMQRIGYDVSMSTAIFTGLPSKVIISSYTAYTHIESIVAGTTTVSESVDYGSSYGGEVSVPAKPTLSPAKAKIKPSIKPSIVVTERAVSVSTVTAAKPELTTLQKLGVFVRILLIILMIVAFGLWLQYLSLKNRKSV